VSFNLTVPLPAEVFHQLPAESGLIPLINNFRPVITMITGLSIIGVIVLMQGVPVYTPITRKKQQKDFDISKLCPYLSYLLMNI